MSGFDEIEPYKCFFIDVLNPRKSAPSAKSAFYRHTDPRTKSTDGKVSGFICVHPRFFYDVTFQTGFTGWTGYDCNSVSDFKEIGV